MARFACTTGWNTAAPGRPLTTSPLYPVVVAGYRATAPDAASHHRLNGGGGHPDRCQAGSLVGYRFGEHAVVAGRHLARLRGIAGDVLRRPPGPDPGRR